MRARLRLARQLSAKVLFYTFVLALLSSSCNAKKKEKHYLGNLLDDAEGMGLTEEQIEAMKASIG